MATESYQPVIHQRETRSLRIAAIARVVVSVALLIGYIFVPVATKSYVLFVGIVSLFIFISIIYYVFADKTRWHDIILYTSAITDGLVVALLPLIMYATVSDGPVPPEYIIKSDVLVVSYIGILGHTLTYRAAAPLIITAFIVGSKFVYWYWAISQGTIVFTDSMVDIFLGPAVNMAKLFNDGVVVTLVFGVLAAIVAGEARRAIVHASEADDANLTKSRFLASMSHELRTPLNAIIGYSEMMKEEMDELQRKENAEDLERIRGAGHHLLSLVNNILDLSKIEAHKLEIAYGPVDLNALARDIETTARPLIKTRHVEFETFVEPDIGPMTSDVLRIKQCLLNLVSNAAKFTSEGRIALTIGKIDVDAIMFVVRDTGIGIAADEIDHLFEEFRQVRTADNSHQAGTGLGLAITRKLARLLGGDVSVDSSPGTGSTFTLMLPVTPRAE